MSPTSPRPVIFFDLGQTLGFECRSADATQPVAFTVYRDIPPLLAHLGRRARLGLSTAGPRWNPGLLRQVLQQSTLDGYIALDLVHYWQADTETQFRWAAERAGVSAAECVFVSPSCARRACAVGAGMGAVDHPGLAGARVDGHPPVRIRARAASLGIERLRALCTADPPVLPLHIVRSDTAVTLYAEASRHALNRLRDTGLVVDELGEPDGVATTSLYLVVDAGVETEARQEFRERIRRDGLLVDADDRRLIVALPAGTAIADVRPPRCVHGDIVELRPDLSILAPADACAPVAGVAESPDAGGGGTGAAT